MIRIAGDLLREKKKHHAALVRSLLRLAVKWEQEASMMQPGSEPATVLQFAREVRERARRYRP